jgi:hypothetical protein
MRTAKRRKRGWFCTLGFGLALWVYASGRAVAQQPEPLPPLPSFTAPPAAQMPSLLSWWTVSNAAASDPVCRVPNFFGDFVARPSGALVDQPAVSTVTTKTLTFFGLPNDVHGGLGSNIYFPPFRPNGIVGPGGPYQIFTVVTGTGVLPLPITSILNENAELTAKIKANFPGAIYAGGTGLLQPPFTVMFDYLNPAVHTVPGLVAVVNLPNPSGGGLVGRNKYFDDGSPLPHDRVFFDYDHVAGFNGLGTSFDINRYVFGVEKTFFNGYGSIEVLVPFAGTANSEQNGGQGMAVSNAEFGNVGLLLKGVLFRNANWAVTAGVGVSMPTADDSRLLFAGRPIIEIRNKAWLVQPIVGAVWAPNDRFYAQTGLQFDFDPNGNPVYVREPGGDFGQRGILTDQTYLYASGAVGYWLYRSDTKFLSALGLQGELHYDRTLGNRDFVQTGSVLVADLNNNIDVLNATTGINVVFRDRTTLALGVSFPVTGNRLSDWNLMARINIPFGKAPR